MNEATTNQPNSSRRRCLTGVAVGSLLAGVAAWGTYVWAHGERGFGHMGWGGYGHGMVHRAEVMEEHMNFMIERVFERAGASEEQKVRAREIIGAAAEDLKPLAKTRHDRHETMLEILTAGTIDRTRLEQERAEMLNDAQQASERLTRAFADLAEVLTPAQRKTVAESLRRLRDVREEWMKHS